MRYRGVTLSRGLVFFCITFLLVLGLFVVPAGAQTDDPIAGQTAFIEVTNNNIVNAIGPVAVAGCTVARDATVVVADEDETQVELVNGQNARITGGANAITIEGTGANGTFENLSPTGDDEQFGSAGETQTGMVISSTGIVCGDSGGTGGDNNANAAETQYNADGKEVTVIIETIPDKKILVDTGGPTLPMIGGLILALGLVGLGIFLLRRT